MTEKIHPGEGVSQPNVSAMEQLGYMYLDGSIPAGDKLHELMTTFDGGPRIIAGPTSHIQGGQVCYEVLESGIQEKLENLARRELHAESVISQGPVILGHNPDATDLGHKVAHPLGEKGISFVRLVHGEMHIAVGDKDATIASTAGEFVIYESSHSAVHFDQDAPFVRPTVTPHRLFILRGALRCKIRPPDGCMLVWAGFSTQPILEAKRRLDIFPFMANYQRRLQLPEPGSRSGSRKYRDYTKKQAI